MFRFDDYEDVFIEDDHYLYACKEAFNWAHLVYVREYKQGHVRKDCFIRSDAAGADYEYLQSLEYAPIDVTLQILEIETKQYLAHIDDMDEDEKDSYLEYKMSEYRRIAE